MRPYGQGLNGLGFAGRNDRRRCAAVGLRPVGSGMHGRRLRTVFLGIMIGLATLVAAQTVPQVAVVPFVDTTGDLVNETLIRSAGESIELALRLIQQHEVVAADIDGRDVLTADLPRLAAIGDAAGVDYLMYGSAARDESGVLRFRIAAYDRSAETVSFEKDAIAFGAIDRRAAVDALVVEALSEFTGTDIEFATIRLLPANAGVYRVEIDGQPAGQNVRLVRRVPTGSRRIEVIEERGELEHVVYRQRLRFSKREAIIIPLEFPAVIEAERVLNAQLNDQLDRTLAAGVASPDAADPAHQLRVLYRRLPEAFPDQAATLPQRAIRAELLEHTGWVIASDVVHLASAGEIAAGQWARTFVEQMRALAGLADILDPVAQTAVNDELHRCIDMLVGSLELARSALVVRREIEGVVAINRAIETIGREFPAATVQVDAISSLDAAIRDYRAEFAERRSVWQWLMVGVGAAALTAGVVYQTEVTGPRQRELDEASSDYTTATTAEDALAAQNRMADAEAQLDSALIVQRGMFAAGGALFATGAVLRSIRLTAPRRSWRAVRNDSAIAEHRAAALAYFDHPDDRRALLVLGNGAEFRVAGTGRFYRTPAYLSELPTGDLSIDVVTGAKIGEQIAIPQVEQLHTLQLAD